MATTITKKIVTFRSGNYDLGASYDRRAVLGTLIEGRTLARTVKNLPITPGPVSDFLHDSTTIGVVTTEAALEGLTLTRERINIALSESEKSNKPLAEEEITAINIFETYEHGATLSKEGEELKLDEKTLQALHLSLTKGLDEKAHAPGSYFAETSRATTPLPSEEYVKARIISDIRLLMREFTAWINSAEIIELGPEVRSMLAHFHILKISPFKTMNGAVARLAESTILASASIPFVPRMLSAFYLKHIETYTRVFEETKTDKKHDLTEFLKFTSKGIAQTLSGIEIRMAFSLRKLAMRDYYDHLREDKEITSGQHELLKTLLEYDRSFKPKELFRVQPLKGLYRKVSERTARRDLTKLVSMELLSKQRESGYRLNMKSQKRLAPGARASQFNRRVGEA